MLTPPSQMVFTYFIHSLYVYTSAYTAVLLRYAAGFMYGNIYDDEERFEREGVFPKLLAQHAEDFSWVSSKTIA